MRCSWSRWVLLQDLKRGFDCGKTYQQPRWPLDPRNAEADQKTGRRPCCRVPRPPALGGVPRASSAPHPWRTSSGRWSWWRPHSWSSPARRPLLPLSLSLLDDSEWERKKFFFIISSRKWKLARAAKQSDWLHHFYVQSPDSGSLSADNKEFRYLVDISTVGIIVNNFIYLIVSN